MKNIFTNKSFLATILLFSISVLHFSQIFNDYTLPGFGADPYLCAFIIKDLVYKISNNLNMFHDEFWNISMFFPLKNVLAFSDPLILQGYLVYFLNKILGVDFFYSLAFLHTGFILLTWVTTAFLIYLLFNNSFVAVVSGWLFAFSDHYLSQTAHFQNTAGWALPLLLVGIVLVIQKKVTFLGVIIGILSILALSLSNLYYFYFSLIVCVLALIAYLLMKSGDYKIIGISNSYSRVLVYILLTITLIIFQLIYFKYSGIQSEYPEYLAQRKDIVFMSANSASWKNLYSGSLISPLYTRLLDPFSENKREIEIAISPGLITFIVSIFSILLCRERTFRYTIGFLLIITGTFFSVIAKVQPEILSWLFDYMPLLENIRAIGRFGILAVLGHIILMSLLMVNVSKKDVLLICLLGLQISERFFPEYKRWTVNTELHEDEKSLVENIKKISPDSVTYLGDISIINLMKISLYHNYPIVNGNSGFIPDKHFFPRTLIDCQSWQARFLPLIKNSLVVLAGGRFEDKTCLEKMNFKGREKIGKFQFYSLEPKL